jgi:hypothetical protein
MTGAEKREWYSGVRRSRGDERVRELDAVSFSHSAKTLSTSSIVACTYRQAGLQAAELGLGAEEEVLVAADIESMGMKVSKQASEAERGPDLTQSELREPHDRRRDHTSRNTYSKAEPAP